MENEELFDAILKKFTGDRSFSRDEIRSLTFHQDLNDDYFVVENHLNFLIGEELLKESSDPMPIVSLTRKGWYIMTNPAQAGYVTKRELQKKREKREKSTLFWAVLAGVGAVLAIIVWVLDKIWKR
jgi:hypothetical protein